MVRNLRFGVLAWSVLASAAFFGFDALKVAEAQPGAASFSPSSAVLAKLTPTGELELLLLDLTEPLPATTPAGLLVWKPIVGRERWAVLKAGGAWPSDADAEANVALNGGVRGNDVRGVGGVPAAGALMATIQLDPLDGTTLTRGAAFVTPSDGAEVLSPRPTIRRPSEKGKLPARTAVISRGNTDEVVLRIPFRDGQSQVVLSEWADWPAALKDGLPPGRYTLRFEKGLELNRFTVLDQKQRRRYWSPIDAMFKLVGDKTDQVALQFAVEHLLSFRTDEDRPSFLGDALDLLESVPSEKLAPPLQQHRTSLRDWLDKLATDPGYQKGRVATLALGTDTDIEPIDAARRSIAAGQWTDALDALDQITADGDDAASRRQRGLKQLYRGVIFAEAGTGGADEAGKQFGQSIETLSALHNTPQGQADLLRVHNNVANFRLLLAQNSLGNHAFQMAAGMDQPVLSCLENLIVARDHYSAAANAAEKLHDNKAASAIRVNQARTSALTADVIRTLDVAEPGQSRAFIAGERAASAEAVRFASAVTKADAASVEPLTQAAAWELLAQLAFRQRDWKAASDHAQQARSSFVRRGELAGVETIERLLGLIAMGQDDRPSALKHFSIAQLLAELQRSRFPQDQTGQARAGYFARHSFIYEKLVELHLADNRPLEALRFAELAKARAAQDLLATLGIAEQEEPVEPRDLHELLADWPKDVAAVEYYLGAERGWGFVIQSGKVTAFPLVDAQGQPVATRQLMTDVRQFLSGIEGQANKMYLRMRGGRAFDNSWQDRLFDFRSTLLPDDVLKDLRHTRQVLIVPQHILHYFPFAALVTERDATPRGKFETVQPKFVIDEPFSLSCSPSLTTWDLIRRRSHAPLNQVRAVGLCEAPGAPPLPGVAKDLDNVRAVYGDRVKQIVDGNAATEKQAKSLLSEPGLLMFATHGFNDPDHPADSYLLFLADEPDPNAAPPAENVLSVDTNDGRLTAREIFAQRINARLIVLSACYSGLGDRSPLPGDDLFGLQRAFLHAGARSVLSGLWDVYDGTAPDLIRQFHEQVVAGKSPSQALAESQRAFLNQRRSGDKRDEAVFLHPYFWSVFCVVGAE